MSVPNRWDEGEVLHRANVKAMLAGPRQSNWNIRTLYLMHQKFNIVSDNANERDKMALSKRAQISSSLRRQLEEVSRAKMNSFDRLALEARNRHLFGNPSRSFDSLIEDAKSRGLDEEGQLQAVIEWGVRPDVYYIVPHPFGSRGSDVRRRNPPKPNKAEVDRSMAMKITWSSTADPMTPWTAVVRRRRWAVQVNDFPEEQLFSLLVNGVEKFSFDTWPKRWSRPDSGR